MPELEVLFEDNHLLVVNKPAGLPTMGAESGDTVHSLAAQYIKQKYNKPGRVFIGIVSRLDAMTSGALVLARTSKAASRLTKQFASKALEASKDLENIGKQKTKSDQAVTISPRKVYLAVVEGNLDAEADHWTDQIRKDESAHRMRLSSTPQDDSKTAELRYQSLAVSRTSTTIAVELLTGRKHQIRTQFADRDHPILGDRKYGSQIKFKTGIALHSWRLQIEHPTKRVPMWFEARLPPSWQKFQNELPSKATLRQQTRQFFPPRPPEIR
ncbi:MAG: RNA pseudouridine synthase [Rhodopirellula sp.]|nr:RNA pseudouridine synthase [Rhodopirellula sp.]